LDSLRHDQIIAALHHHYRWLNNHEIHYKTHQKIMSKIPMVDDISTISNSMGPLSLVQYSNKSHETTIKSSWRLVKPARNPIKSSLRLVKSSLNPIQSQTNTIKPN
jgi:hypothetical protein